MVSGNWEIYSIFYRGDRVWTLGMNSGWFYDGHFFGAAQYLRRVDVCECFYLWEIRSYTKIWESRESLAFARKNGRD